MWVSLPVHVLSAQPNSPKDAGNISVIETGSDTPTKQPSSRFLRSLATPHYLFMCRSNEHQLVKSPSAPGSDD